MSFDFRTLGFQAVSVLVLIWLLQRFFWKPVAATISERQAKAATVLQDAVAKRTEAVAALAKVDSTREGFATERETILADARKNADAARDALLGQARAEACTLQETAKATRVREAATLKKAALEDAKGLALTIAGQLAARLDGAATDAAFLGWLIEGPEILPASDRKALVESGTLDLVSAVQLDAKGQDHITKAVSKALWCARISDVPHGPRFDRGV